MNELTVKANGLISLNYGENEVRTVVKDGEPWWVLKDVCDVLNIENPSQVAERLDDDEKGVCQIYTLGGEQEMLVVNESGLYSVIVRSDKPEAKLFKRWITHDVLPRIRRSGNYSLTANPAELLTLADSHANVKTYRLREFTAFRR